MVRDFRTVRNTQPLELQQLGERSDGIICQLGASIEIDSGKVTAGNQRGDGGVCQKRAPVQNDLFQTAAPSQSSDGSVINRLTVAYIYMRQGKTVAEHGEPV
jgi:hypothetical protein